MKADPKVLPPDLLCWPTTSEEDVGDTAVEAESSLQYSIAFCCCVAGCSKTDS